MAGLTSVGFCLVAALVGASCSSDANDRGYDSALEMLRARSAAAAQISFYEGLGEALPNTRFGETPATASPVVSDALVGVVESVEPGYGFWVPGGGDAPAGTRIDFDDKRAAWKTVHLNIDVADSLSGSTPPRTIRAGLAIAGGGDSHRYIDELETLGRVVVFLDAARSEVFSYDPDVVSIVENGGLIATIGADEVLSLPALEPERAAALLRGSETLTKLRQQSRQPVQVIRLRRLGNSEAPLARAPDQPCTRCQSS